MPARQKSKDQLPIEVADLDAMLVDPVSFVLHGKTHVINPLSVEQFARVTLALEKLYGLQAESDVTAEKLIDRYFDLISTCCATVSKDDIANMSQYQIGALLEIILNTITGKIFSDSGKKKLNHPVP